MKKAREMKESSDCSFTFTIDGKKLEFAESDSEPPHTQNDLPEGAGEAPDNEDVVLNAQRILDLQHRELIRTLETSARTHEVLSQINSQIAEERATVFECLKLQSSFLESLQGKSTKQSGGMINQLAELIAGIAVTEYASRFGKGKND